MVAFSYAGSQSAGSQTYKLTTAAATPTITGVAVNCSPTTLAAGASEVCAASVAGTGSYSSAVTWSTSAGSITVGGVLTAPATGTSVTVRATSKQDPTKYATANIALTQSAKVSSVELACFATMMPVSRSMPCAATAVGVNNPSPAVTWSASAGSITPAGVLTAPSTGASLVVTATSVQDPTKSASATIAILKTQEILNPTFIVTPTTIVVSWNLTELAYSSVSYNSGQGSPTLTPSPTNIAATHASYTLTGLTPGTTYNATLLSTNKWGSVSQALSITTPLK
jgi:hypothetical protein